MEQQYIGQMFLVGLGGGLGSITRFIVDGLTYRLLPFAGLPYGTLAVNVIGCFLIGFLNGLVEIHQVFSPNTRLFLFIGFLGGFTTFSTFGYETVSLAREVEAFQALIYIGLHLFVGLTAVWLGQQLASLHWQ